jgi:hypothetical protein
LTIIQRWRSQGIVVTLERNGRSFHIDFPRNRPDSMKAEVMLALNTPSRRQELERELAAERIHGHRLWQWAMDNFEPRPCDHVWELVPGPPGVLSPAICGKCGACT